MSEQEKRYEKWAGNWACNGCGKYRNTLRSIQRHWKQAHGDVSVLEAWKRAVEKNPTIPRD